MRAIVTVAQREIVDKRRLVFASLALGGLTLVLPLFPITGGVRANYAATRDIIAAVLGFVLLNAVAIGSGMNAIARDMTERRMSFYFARPLTGIDIWGGKMIGGLLLAVACAVAVIIPATMSGGGLFALRSINSQYFSTTSPSMAFAASLSLAAIGLILTHPLSIALRSRSRWLILDFVAWNVVGFSLFAISTMLQSRDEMLAQGVTKVFGAIFLLALLVGGALQLVVGRTDIVRGHRVMSVAIWSTATAVVIAIAGWIAWIESSTPRDLHRAGAAYVSPGGDWVSIEGSRRFSAGYPLQFLVNLKDGRYVKQHAARWSYIPSISDDSSHAVWFEKRTSIGSKPRFVAMWSSLRGPEPRPVETMITDDTEPVEALSPDGIRLVTIDGEWNAVVTDLAARRTLVAVRLPMTKPLFYWRVRPLFLDRDHVRIYVQSDTDPNAGRSSSLTVGEIDIPARTYAITGVVPASASFVVNRARDRIIVSTGTPSAELRDGRTGSLITSFPRTGIGVATFIPNRRIAICDVENGLVTLRIYDIDGRLLRSIPLRQGVSGSIAWAVAEGQLLVETYTRPLEEGVHSIDLVDVDHGTIRSLGTTTNRRLWYRSAEIPVARSLFNSEDGRVVELNPATGQWRDILR